MHLYLELKTQCSFFWLRAIHGVRIDKCCAECFHAKKDNRVYYGTLHKKRAIISIDVAEDPGAKAYYLCGLSAGMNWENNTHVAFIHASGEKLVYNSDQVGIIVTDAVRIPFNDYVPNPVGTFTDQQRKCRNWIFANYVKDGMLDRFKEDR